jgi:hypothetical protein
MTIGHFNLMGVAKPMPKITVEILEVIKSGNYELIGMGDAVEIVEHRNDGALRIKMTRDTFNAMARELLRRAGVYSSAGAAGSAASAENFREVVVRRERAHRSTPKPWINFETGSEPCTRCGSTGGVGKPNAKKAARYTSARITPAGPYCKACYTYMYETQTYGGRRLAPEEVELLKSHGKYVRGRPIEDSKEIIAKIKAGAI